MNRNNNQTELPVNVRSEIIRNAQEYTQNYIYNNDWVDTAHCSYIEGATAYATKLYQADETIKDLERWKAEALCLLSKIDDYADGHPEIKLGMGKVEFTIERAMKYDESAAGREDAVEFAEWAGWDWRRIEGKSMWENQKTLDVLSTSKLYEKYKEETR